MQTKKRVKVNPYSEPKKRAYFWKDEYYVLAYRLAADGASRNGIAEGMGVPKARFDKFLENRPAFLAAVRLGESRKKELQSQSSTFFDYVKGHMPNHLREAWDRIMLWESYKADDRTFKSEERIDALLADKGDRFRQHLWVYALAMNNFDAGEAGRLAGVGPGTVRRWKETDPDFPQVLEVVLAAKKDMCEGALMRLVTSGDSPAVIFANKTLNSDRYAPPKKTLEVQGGVRLEMQEQLNLEEVLNDLSVEAQSEVLEALRRRRELKAGGALPPKQLN